MADIRTKLTIDLNSDMGEGYGAWTMGADAEMLEIVSSANVACGFHAGDPEIMAATFSRAKERKVAVGAHPGYPDLWGFGRRAMTFSPGEIERLIAYQVGAALALSTYAGHRITFVKTHGALANLAQENKQVARAIVNALKAVDPKLIFLTFPVGHTMEFAREAGLRVCTEIFADRAYTEDGNLAPRSMPGAVIHDAEAAAARVLRMIRASAIETASGRLLPCSVDSICVHSDTPSAVQMAAKLKAVLEAEGVGIRPFSSLDWPRLDWLEQGPEDA